MKFSLLIAQFILLGTTSAFRDYQEFIPNGDRVPDPCHPNKLWQGVGHKQITGGSTRNKFGEDFKKAERKWTETLCRGDSDGDGRTNGQELGDPNCVWKIGEVPEYTDNLTHPGVCDPYDSVKCQTTNDWKICQEQGFDCPLKDGEGVIKETYRMTRNKVPAKETTYQCQYLDFPTDRDYHLIASEPYIDNANVMHHIFVRGCPDDVVAQMKLDVSEPKECGDLAMKCNVLLSGWTLGSFGSCLDAPAAFRFGKDSFKGFLFEFHWNNPTERDDYWDESGMTLYYTPNLRPYDAGVFITGALHLMIPPQQREFTVESVCPARCTRKLLKEPIYFIRGVHHMHLTGAAGYVEHGHDGEKDMIIDIPNYSYNSPETYNYKPGIMFKPGDDLKTTCVYETMDRSQNTYSGDATSSEMCHGFFTYYPAIGSGGNLGCFTFGDADCMTLEESDCNMIKVTMAKPEIVKNLYTFCDPTGRTCPDGCLSYLTTMMKGDPCWDSIMREMSQTVVTDRFTNTNVTNMLLKCEHMHDFDILLADGISSSNSVIFGYTTMHVYLIFVFLYCV